MSTEIFESVPLKSPKRSNFNLSHEVKGTTDGGILTPFFCQEVLPADKWKMRTELLMKAQTLSAPIMHEVNIYVHFFFVPYRLIWEDAEEFYTGGEDGLSTPVYPTYTFPEGLNAYSKNQLGPGSLMDYLGFPVKDTDDSPYGLGPGDEFSALPFRAYQLIWNEYYRDQNLQDPIEIDKTSGRRDLPNPGEGRTIPELALRYRCWRKDYFTSALPFAQRGPDVRLPIDLADSRVVLTAGSQIGQVQGNNFPVTLKGRNGAAQVGATVQKAASAPSSIQGWDGTETEGFVKEIRADMETEEGVNVVGTGDSFEIINKDGSSTLSGPTINEVRRSVRAQEFFERQARGGGRYKETVYNQFGVTTSDARLQRPEYLGGGVQPLVVNELLQTSQTTETSPQGTQTGNVVSLGSSNQFRRFFTEHGLIMGIMSIVPKANYQQGMPRQWLRRDRFDFAWPVLANIGEQEIKQAEIFYSGDPTKDARTFGYTPRYAEYKYIPSSVHGHFRRSMDFWHLGRIFNSSPGLNGNFVSVKPSDFDRIFPISAGDAPNPGRFYYQIYNHVYAKRALPKFGVPTL